MTLVARFFRAGMPFMIGDLLVSKPSWQDVNANLPTLPRRAQALAGVTLGSQSWAASDLVQKVILLNDRVVIGWSGKMQVAREIVHGLRRDLELVNDVAQVKNVIDGVPESALKEINILGFALTKDNVIRFNAGNGITAATSSELEELYVTGSGCESFLANLSVGGPDLRLGETTTWTQAIIDVSQMVGHLILREMASLQTLLKLYGGGYEIAYVSFGKFQKFDDLLYTVWQATFKGDDISVDFLHMFKYGYSNEDLVIRTIDIDQQTRYVQETDFCVPPVDSQKPHAELLNAKSPEIPSRFVSILVMVVDEHWKYRGSYSFFLNQPDLDKMRVKVQKYNVVGSRGKMDVEVEMDDMILDAVRKMAKDGREAGRY